MVTVKIDRREGRIQAFTLSGHANSGPYGQDIVCAGVSAVVIGTENAVDSLCRVRLVTAQNEQEGGYLRCEVPENLDESAESKVQLLLEAMVVSIQSIAGQYGKYIQLVDTRR